MSGNKPEEARHESTDIAEDWLYLCDTAEIPEGEIGGAKHPKMAMALAIYNVEGEFYVTSDRCTHAGASLYDEGELDGCVVECGWHNGTFDVRTGAALTMPCRVPLPSYDARVEKGKLYVSPRPRRRKSAG